MNIGYIGLGKMGRNMVLKLLDKGWRVVVYDPSKTAMRSVTRCGAKGSRSIREIVGELRPPRLIWIMVPYHAVESVLGELIQVLSRGDTIIDGGNTFFGDSIKHASDLQKQGINFLDAGVSGGPKGARNGACIMVGGARSIYKRYKKLFRDLAAPSGYAHVGNSGAGHFVKMVHNGIEYGMMQALAEGFAMMKLAPFGLNLKDIAALYNHGSVIESRLLGWLGSGFKKYGEQLNEVSGSVASTGEGEWSVKTAKKLGVPVPIIKGALAFRAQSQKNPSYVGKILSVLRNQFGGHDIGGN
jgi:6-phosphogluconate dehydrogenase